VKIDSDIVDIVDLNVLYHLNILFTDQYISIFTQKYLGIVSCHVFKINRQFEGKNCQFKINMSIIKL
jgi:hypothetical protein